MNKVLHLILAYMLIFSFQIQCLHIKHDYDNPDIYTSPSNKKETVSFTSQENQLQLQNYPIQLRPLITYIISDPQLSTSATSNSPLSQPSANKLRAYVQSNPNLTNLLYKIFANLSPNQECFMNLNEEDQIIIKNEIINQIDWKNLLKDFHNQIVGEEQVDRMFQKIKENNQISDNANQCFNQDEDSDLE